MRAPNRCMISVQNRPVPATCQGCAAQASRKPRRRLGALGRQAPRRCRSGRSRAPARRAASPRSAPSSRRWRRHRATAATPVRSSSVCLDQPLHRMRRLDVVRRVGADGAGDAEKARVLARAVVVDRARRAAFARQRLRRRLVDRPVRAALQRAEHRARRASSMRVAVATWPGSPRMRGAGQRQFLGPRP